ncbi:hypothetical protein [Facilibium subflavum]|uniref:hypothetical protein n=1 Tax=Facilibium subflavum TaxID=2219058 RepID=UPI000E650DE6|nr:hypothetical protein [Facilibium subflavum]
MAKPKSYLLDFLQLDQPLHTAQTVIGKGEFLRGFPPKLCFSGRTALRIFSDQAGRMNEKFDDRSAVKWFVMGI